MSFKRFSSLLAVLVLLTLFVNACNPQEVQVEVTRVITETEEVEVTRVITETIEVEGQPVEVTRVVEAPAAPEFPEGTRLQILQWSHFVPNYDKWIDPFAQEWGRANGVEVTVDHVDIASLNPALTAAIDAGEGPTLVELPLAAANFVEGVHDLTELNMRAQEMFGPQAETCTANSYLPAADMWYGYCHGWVPDPGDYDIAKWTAVGYPNGPTTWEELLIGGAAIKEQFGVPMGLGLSPEIDSNMAMRAIIWSFGGATQDENECVTINSPEVLEAIQYVVDLYNQTMTEEVFSWNAASNNQGLIAGELSYILNSISAYRSLQKIDPAAADNIGFSEALRGPRGDQHASAHLWYIYVIPNYVEEGSPEYKAAEEFMLHLTANYNQATFNSELYNFPAFETTVPQLTDWLTNDPFGSRPADKLTVLLTAKDWVTYLGWPGPSSPAEAEVYATNIIPTMMGRAALGEVTPEEAIAEAEAQINAIFDKWRDKGFVGCAG
ncbi:MAG: extracellular solute-binding protein [Chloroflexi bacterium]|nr:extracellular solute-binding protein [Chloroflexota bacterium]MCI0579444.1 extracellular solute-binding protein [Chloroflexota bacterium]MCI0644991.1 extracellular solute-binding protein [Chloroflexota bacterium]MCI0732181.1 extracellular solute-binding protein [Chloroflexota bacterium]